MTTQRPNDFVWANDPQTNISEPFDDLKKQGWQYGDVPTAAHFNWLFCELGKWQTYLEEQSNLTANMLESVKIELKATQRVLVNTANVINMIRDRVMAHHSESPRLPLLRIHFASDESNSSIIEEANES